MSGGIERIFKRRSDQFWWHWRPTCNIWLAMPSMKHRGKVIVYTTLVKLRPTTYTLCPGCHAIDRRITTKAYPYVSTSVVGGWATYNQPVNAWTRV